MVGSHGSEIHVRFNGRRPIGHTYVRNVLGDVRGRCREANFVVSVPYYLIVRLNKTRVGMRLVRFSTVRRYFSAYDVNCCLPQNYKCQYNWWNLPNTDVFFFIKNSNNKPR